MPTRNLPPERTPSHRTRSRFCTWPAYRCPAFWSALPVGQPRRLDYHRQWRWLRVDWCLTCRYPVPRGREAWR